MSLCVVCAHEFRYLWRAEAEASDAPGVSYRSL